MLAMWSRNILFYYDYIRINIYIYILNPGAFLIKGSDEQMNISRKISWLMSNARIQKMAMTSLVFAAYSAVL